MVPTIAQVYIILEIADLSEYILIVIWTPSTWPLIETCVIHNCSSPIWNLLVSLLNTVLNFYLNVPSLRCKFGGSVLEYIEMVI